MAIEISMFIRWSEATSGLDYLTLSIILLCKDFEVKMSNFADMAGSLTLHGLAIGSCSL